MKVEKLVKILIYATAAILLIAFGFFISDVTKTTTILVTAADGEAVNREEWIDNTEELYEKLESLHPSTSKTDAAATNPSIGILTNLDTLVNINTATKEELITLPGIGEVIANKIIRFRLQNGKFKNIIDIQNVSGIGEKKYSEIQKLITV